MNYLQLGNINSQQSCINAIYTLKKYWKTEWGDDILANENYHTFKFSQEYNIYDPDCYFELKKHGADFINSIGEGELKSCKIERPSRYGNACFHAKAITADITHHKQFLFKSMYDDNTVRFYHITKPENVNWIHYELLELAEAWENKVSSGKISGKHDMVSLPEKVYSNILKDFPVYAINKNEETVVKTGRVSSVIGQKEEYDPNIIYFQADNLL